MPSTSCKDHSSHNDERVVVACDVIQQLRIVEDSPTYNMQKQLQQQHLQHQGGRSSSSSPRSSSSDLVTLETSSESSEKVQVERSTLLKSFRPIIVSWMYTLSTTFNLNHSVVPTAAYYLDQVVSHSILQENNKDDGSVGILIQSTQEYQLLSLTCLHVAMKLYETKLFPIDQLLKLGGTENNFTATQIEQTELAICKILNWNLHPPTCHCYFQQYMILLRTIIGNGDEEDDDILEQIEKESQRVIQIVEIERGDGYNFETSDDLDAAYEKDDTKKRTRYIPPSVVCFATMLLVLERFVEDYQVLSWEAHFVPFVKQIQRITQISDKYMDGILLDALLLVDEKKNKRNEEKRDDDDNNVVANDNDTLRKQRDVADDDDASTDSTATTVSSTSRTDSSRSRSNSSNIISENDNSTCSIETF